MADEVEIKKCRHCGRYIRQFEGVWHHYWWVKDVAAPGERSMRGSLGCAWHGAPTDEVKVAAP